MFRTKDFLSLDNGLPVSTLMLRLEKAFSGPVNTANYKVKIEENRFFLECRRVSGDLSTPLIITGRAFARETGSRMDFRFELRLTFSHHLFLIVWCLMLAIMLNGGMIHWIARDIGGGSKLVGVLGVFLFLFIPYQLSYGSIPYMKFKLKHVFKKIGKDR